MFPRTIEPESVTGLWLPTGLRDVSHTGRIQLRTSHQSGWVWSEQFRMLKATDPDSMEILAYMRNAWNRQLIFDIKHLLTPGSGLARLSSVTPAGSVTVSGAGQTGSSIDIAGWPVSTSNCMLPGEVLSIENRLYEVAAAADSDGSGVASVSITPSLPTDSPADAAVVTISDVTIRAMIWSLPRFPMNVAPDYYTFQVGFREVFP